MADVAMTLLTIVTEDVLEPRLLRELREYGFTGYTLTQSIGEGSRGMRQGPEGSNIRVEALAPIEVVDAFVEHLRMHYFSNYAVAAWLTDVRVVRGENYRPPVQVDQPA